MQYLYYFETKVTFIIKINKLQKSEKRLPYKLNK